jgi:hypothetical protein
MVQVTDGLFVIFILISGTIIFMINHLNLSGTSIDLRSDELLTLYAIFIFCILHNTKCLIADKASLVEDSPPASFLTWSMYVLGLCVTSLSGRYFPMSTILFKMLLHRLLILHTIFSDATFSDEIKIPLCGIIFVPVVRGIPRTIDLGLEAGASRETKREKIFKLKLNQLDSTAVVNYSVFIGFNIAMRRAHSFDADAYRYMVL